MSGMRLARGWNVVVGSAVGITFGSVVFFTSSYSLLGPGFARRTHWSQIELSTGATVFLTGLLLSWPTFGWLLDKFGTRLIAATSIVLFAVGLILLSFTNTLFTFYIDLGFLGLLGGGTNVISYARAISVWFDRRRGFMLGLAASSQAIGAMLIPLSTQAIIGRAGPRAALLTLASIELLLCFPAVTILVRDEPPNPAGSPATFRLQAPHWKAKLSKKVLMEAMHTGTFWSLCICFSIGGFTVFTIFSNITFILGGIASIGPTDIAQLQALAGAAVLFGRLLCGVSLDRVDPLLVSACTFCLAGCSVTLYAWSSSKVHVVCATILMGLSAGSESDVMPFLASRFYGVLSSSRILGWFLFSGGLFSAIGPVGFAHLAMFSRDVRLPLIIIAGLQCVAIVLLLMVRAFGKAVTIFTNDRVRGEITQLIEAKEHR